MKARLLSETTNLFAQMSTTSTCEELRKGEEIEIGPTKKAEGQTWVTVTRPNGNRGYILGNTKIYTIKNSTLVAKTVQVLRDPQDPSSEVTTYKKGQRFEIIGTASYNGTLWAEIRDASGVRGYILGSTKVRTDPVKAPSNPSHDLVVGGLWCVGGIVVTAWSYSAASQSNGGGEYFVAWGAILFGGIQFLKGLGGLAFGGD